MDERQKETCMIIQDWEDYAYYRDQVAEFEFWRKGRTSYRPAEVPESLRHVDNEMRGAVEQWEFRQSPPSRYFAYVGIDGSITTWTGHKLSASVSWGREYQMPAFGGFPTTRQNFRMIATNGREYSGTYYKSSGDYCRMKRIG
jgi:hypothetical protein